MRASQGKEVNGLLPNIHTIQSVFDRRLLNTYLFIADKAILIDSGLAYTPEETIFPYLKKINLPVEKIDWLVVTHASGDHYGGNGAIKRRAPHIKIIAHSRDAPAIASHDQFIREHITALKDDGIPVPAIQADDRGFLDLNGVETAIDWVVQGGEKIKLSANSPVALIHVPGHTPGHLAVYEPIQGALFCGDAIMGRGIPDISGRLVMPPHYFDVHQYLSTISLALLLKPQYIFLTHYPPIAHHDVMAFLDSSRTFVLEFHALLMDFLRKSRKPLSIIDIIPFAQKSLGIPDSEYQYGLLIRAHLQMLVDFGQASMNIMNGVPYWTLAE